MTKYHCLFKPFWLNKNYAAACVPYSSGYCSWDFLLFKWLYSQLWNNARLAAFFQADQAFDYATLGVGGEVLHPP